jgi:hypothetical protein
MSITTYEDRLDWKTKDGETPLSAFLVGGLPNYNNVAKLPDLLWNECGIAVIQHISKRANGTMAEPDLAIVLTDQCSHELSRWAEAKAGRAVRSASTWSRLSSTLQSLGLELRPGALYHKPKASPPIVAKTVSAPPKPKKGTLTLLEEAMRSRNRLAEVELLNLLVEENPELSKGEIGQLVGRGRPWVSARIQVAKRWTPEIRKAVAEGRFGIDRAYDLVRAATQETLKDFDKKSKASRKAKKAPPPPKKKAAKPVETTVTAQEGLMLSDEIKELLKQLKERVVHTNLTTLDVRISHDKGGEPKMTCSYEQVVIQRGEMQL